MKTFTDTVRRIRSDRATEPAELVGNRLAAFGGTVGIGGSVALIATYYFPVPEQIHTHVVAVIVFLVQTGVFLLQKRFGGTVSK